MAETYTATWRYAKITARKARALTDLICNKPVNEALDLLKFTKRRGAVMVAKVLKSDDIVNKLRERGFEATTSTSDELARMIRDEGRSWAQLIKERNITME